MHFYKVWCHKSFLKVFTQAFSKSFILVTSLFSNKLYSSGQWLPSMLPSSGIQLFSSCYGSLKSSFQVKDILLARAFIWCFSFSICSHSKLYQTTSPQAIDSLEHTTSLHYWFQIGVSTSDYFANRTSTSHYFAFSRATFSHVPDPKLTFARKC